MKKNCFTMLSFATFLAVTSPLAGRAAVPATSPITLQSSQEEYVTDINNHLKKLTEALKAKDAAQAKESSGFLREDAKALVKTITGLDAKDQKRLTALRDDVISFTGRIEKHADKGTFGEARELLPKLKKSITGIEGLASAPSAKKPL